MINEYGLISALKSQSNIWHLEVYGQPFCQHHSFNKELMACEYNLNAWNNQTLCQALDRIEEIIDVKPLLVKGSCPHTKFNLETASQF